VKQEVQEKLYKKYPKIFKQKDLPMTETCMCWGINCADGWYALIDNLCWYISKTVEHEKCPPIEAVQVKQKFGGLRFYTGGIDKKISSEINNYINFAEGLSLSICEECGTTTDVKQTKSGWVVTLCPTCMEKFNRTPVEEMAIDDK